MRDISESQINTADVKALFKDAVSMRNTPTGLGKVFKGLRKDTIDINDLQQAWKDDGFPDDITDIARILKDHGFSVSEVNKVFSNVLGGSNDGEEFDAPVASATIQKVADYINKKELTNEIIEFMKREYQFNESMFYPNKVVVEDIRQIFSAIVHEERSARTELIKKNDINQLGRGKK